MDIAVQILSACSFTLLVSMGWMDSAEMRWEWEWDRGRQVASALQVMRAILRLPFVLREGVIMHWMRRQRGIAGLSMIMNELKHGKLKLS
jgi:hypothetical protein